MGYIRIVLLIFENEEKLWFRYVIGDSAYKNQINYYINNIIILKINKSNNLYIIKIYLMILAKPLSNLTYNNSRSSQKP
jgi:hypothetical protein